MEDKTRGEISESIILPEKTFLNEETLLEIWHVRGLKFRIDEFYAYCCDRGLMSHFHRESFRAKIFSVLEKFLVKGEVRRDPKFVPSLKLSKRV